VSVWLAFENVKGRDELKAESKKPSAAIDAVTKHVPLLDAEIVAVLVEFESVQPDALPPVIENVIAPDPLVPLVTMLKA
jgi:hypothetical protein